VGVLKLMDLDEGVLMKLIHRSIYSAICLSMLSVGIIAQEPNPTAQQRGQAPPVEMRNGIAYYKIQVVDRTLPAVNYFHRSGSTHIGFEGTALMPGVRGEAKVEAKGGRAAIDLEMQNLSPANGFGNEYLTYVLWAVTPEGRPVNLGEVLPTGSRDKIHMSVTTDLQSFGLMVTAEPYFAVTMPSDLVVAQNSILPGTTGVIGAVTAHYTLLPRGAYSETAGRHTVLHPITRNERTPLEVYEAENALMIAEAAGADKYASDSIETAKTDLKNAEDLNLHRQNEKETITYAREAVQASEDARIVTIRKIKAEDEAADKQARYNAEQNAEESRRQADQSAQQAEQARLAQQDAAQRAQAAAAQQAQAEAATAAAQAEAQKAREERERAEQSAQQASQQEQQMRERLKEQLNQVLQTRDTARGLIVNMSDVLFAFNKYDLKPEAREKLAKVSGILIAYPDLKVQVEGHTDNIGSDEYNQKLSEQRADAVRDYLGSQNVSENNVTAAGYGKSDPIADNSTNEGRAQNRRVELVVSGSSIGVQEHPPSAQPASSQDQPPATVVTPSKPQVPDSMIPH
jgi:outer membrane protein OmpA-like peptidoglycan-associated protein